MMRFLRRTFGRGSMRRYQSPGERDRRGRGGIGTLPQPHPHLHQQQLHHVPTVVTGGAVVHIPAAGNSKSVLTCRVLLLDGTDVSVDLPKTLSYSNGGGSSTAGSGLAAVGQAIFNLPYQVQSKIRSTASRHCSMLRNSCV
ncbi:UNVERIFIED_CONTAM: hypothetical protein FKN15_029749 [Acipenser sinensis]